MSIQIIINGDSATEALHELSTLAAGFTGGNVVALPVKAQVEKPKRPAGVKPEPEKEADPEPVQESENEDSTPDDSDVPIPSLVELRAKAQEAGKAAGKPAIKALLDKYNSASITDVPEDQRAAFLAALEALL